MGFASDQPTRLSQGPYVWRRAQRLAALDVSKGAMNSHRTIHRDYERPDQWKHQATVILTGLHPRVLKSLTFASPNLPGAIQPASRNTHSLDNQPPPGREAYDSRPDALPGPASSGCLNQWNVSAQTLIAFGNERTTQLVFKN